MQIKRWLLAAILTSCYLFRMTSLAHPFLITIIFPHQILLHPLPHPLFFLATCTFLSSPYAHLVTIFFLATCTFLSSPHAHPVTIPFYFILNNSFHHQIIYLPFYYSHLSSWSFLFLELFSFHTILLLLYARLTPSQLTCPSLPPHS